MIIWQSWKIKHLIKNWATGLYASRFIWYWLEVRKCIEHLNVHLSCSRLFVAVLSIEWDRSCQYDHHTIRPHLLGAPTKLLHHGRHTINASSFLPRIINSLGAGIVFGSILLVPLTVISHEIILRTPNNYYVQWLKRDLIQGIVDVPCHSHHETYGIGNSSEVSWVLGSWFHLATSTMRQKD